MPNVSEAAQAKVEAVRLLLPLFTVPCPHVAWDVKHGHSLTPQPCERCANSGLIPDPDLAGLRELVEEECQGICLEVSSESCECRGTLRVTRDWTHFLSGSLYGAAMERLPNTMRTYFNGCLEVDLPPPLHYRQFPLVGPDPDLAIMTALEAALKAQLEARNA